MRRALLFAYSTRRRKLLNPRIPVDIDIIPNLILLETDYKFASVVRFPDEVDVTGVDISSVQCEGAPALKVYPKEQIILFIYNISDLRTDLESGFDVTFTVTGWFENGNQFSGSDTVVSLRKKDCVVYHTSTRSGSACNACRGHSANKIFSSEAAANRPHRGCNCKIVTEIIYWRDYAFAFWPTSKGSTEVYDKRWGWPPPLPRQLILNQNYS